MANKICLAPKLAGLGGPVSFQAKLAAGLERRGFEITYDLDDPSFQSLLVTGSLLRLDRIWGVARRGVRIVQRLDGMNWIHHRRWMGFPYFIRSEGNNFLISTLRRRLADRLVYQSHFVQDWWERVSGKVPAQPEVIYNGVDLSVYTPDGSRSLPVDCYRILLVEGHFGGGNEVGLANAIHLARFLIEQHHLPIELCIAGDAPSSVRGFEQFLPPGTLRWAGVVSRESIPDLDRSAHLLFSADLHAACPNSVIEALACGLPVVSFATGALPELVQGGAGEVVPYGGDPWQLRTPDIPALARAAAAILDHLPEYQAAARRRAEQSFGLDRMVEQYLQVLL